MKKLDENKLVNFNQELELMIDYTLNTWDGKKEDLIEIITQSFTAGYEAANNWLDEYSSSLSNLSDQWMKKREELGERTDMMFYDDVTKVAKNLMMNTNSFRRFIMNDWNYSKNTESLTKSIKSTVSFKEILPKGWQEVQDSGQSAFEKFEYFNLKEDKKFKGYNSDSAGAPGFHERINIAHTYYGDSEQGRTPLYTLVSSAFAHGLTMRQHNNTLEVLKEAKRIQEVFSKPEFNKPTFIGDLNSLSDNTLFKDLMLDKYSINDKKEYNSQSELEAYIKEKNENKYIYGMVTWNMYGSDDYRHTGFKIHKIYSLENFEKQIKDNVEAYFAEENYQEIYYSDNNFSTVSKNEVLSSLTFKQISQKEFNVFKNNLGGHDSVQYGDTKDFMDYNYPTKKEIIALNAEHIKNLMNSLSSETPTEKKETDNREQLYHEALTQLLGMKKSSKNKPK